MSSASLAYREQRYAGVLTGGYKPGRFGVQLTADRVQSIWLAGAPSPVTAGGGTASVITGAQFAA